jgi:ABC-type transport system involved in cytochrome bd biosynthesis fused ATPase/permease subunit
MFYISTLELTLTCALIIMLFIVPVIVKRAYAKMDKRIKNLENKVDKKRD